MCAFDSECVLILTNLLIKAFIKDYKSTDKPSVRTSYGKLSGIVGIVCNVFLFTSKLIIGILSSSVAIIADSVNNLSDAASSVISLVGFKLSSKPADDEHPYGHGRYEYLSALLVAVIVMVIGVELFKTSIGKIINPQSVAFGMPLVLVLAVSITVKLWMMKFNKSIGKIIDSHALKATAADSRNDAIATLAVLLASVISHYTGYELDGFIGLGVSVFILISGIGLVKETIDPMLGCAPNAELTDIIKNMILSCEDVIGVHDLIVHDYGPNKKFASVHVEMPAELDPVKSHEIIDNIERELLVSHGIHLIIHFDPIVTKKEVTDNLYYKIEKAVKEIDPRLSIHDLKAEKNDEGTHLYFDCILTDEIKLCESDLITLIENKIREFDSSLICHITVDKSFAPIVK